MSGSDRASQADKDFVMAALQGNTDGSGGLALHYMAPELKVRPARRLAPGTSGVGVRRIATSATSDQTVRLASMYWPA